MFEFRDLEVTSESTDPFSISIVPGERDLNINGTVHGGLIFFICDDIIGRYVTHIGRQGAAADSHIHFYRPARSGVRLTATVSERKVGRRLGTYLVELKDPDGLLIADALFTVAFV